MLNVNVNIFPSTNLYANINSLIPQTASANFRRRGASLGISDAYQFDSGMVLTTVVRYTNFYTSDHGQGSLDMTINPEGWGGNYFNAFSRNANQLEALPVLQLPAKSWHGNHRIAVWNGYPLSVVHREQRFASRSISWRRTARSIETIDFSGRRESASEAIRRSRNMRRIAGR